MTTECPSFHYSYFIRSSTHLGNLYVINEKVNQEYFSLDSFYDNDGIISPFSKFEVLTQFVNQVWGHHSLLRS